MPEYKMVYAHPLMADLFPEGVPNSGVPSSLQGALKKKKEFGIVKRFFIGIAGKKGFH